MDWRGVLCRFLNILPESTDDDILKVLDDVAGRMEAANRQGSDSLGLPPRGQIINRVACSNSHAEEDQLYLEDLWVVNSGPRNAHLRGSKAIDNLELYLERNKDVSFIAYRDFQCCGREPSYLGAGRGRFDRPITEPSQLMVGESVCIISDDLRLALEQIAGGALQAIQHPPFEIEGEFSRSVFLVVPPSRTTC
jgi:hypothetical protein